MITRLTYLIAIIEPIITLPQAIQIFRNQNASGVSISSWVFYELFTIVWIWYGVLNKDKVIITYSVLYAFVQAAVIVGASLYGGSLL